MTAVLEGENSHHLGSSWACLFEVQGQAQQFPFFFPTRAIAHAADDRGNAAAETVDITKVVEHLHDEMVARGGIAESDLFE